jgi:hypothetical protein
MDVLIMAERNTSNFRTGKPYRFIEYGEECCTCAGVDYAALNFPEGIHCRVGAGTKESGAFHQDCAVLLENADRIRVMPYLTDAGVTVNVIRLEGDHDERTGGAYLLKPLDHPATWAAGQGLRTTFIFSPQDPRTNVWYINYELRGELAFAAHNEGSAALGVAIRNDRIKVMYYRDAQDGDGGGARQYIEMPFAFEQFGWYELNTRLEPDPLELNTWTLRVKLRSLSNRSRRLVWNAPKDMRPNRIISLAHAGCGDEHQGLSDGGVWLLSKIEDTRIE